MRIVEGDNGLDWLMPVLRRWKAIAACTILGFGLASLYAVTATEWFESRLTVVPSTTSREGAAAALAAKLPGLDPTTADSKRIEAVLLSQSVADAVIEKFNLRERYGTKYMEDVRAALAKRCPTDVDKKSGVVGLVCEDPDPQLARDMTAYFGEVGNKVFGRISASSAHAEATFLATQVETARKDVDAASRALRDFSENHKLVDLSEQAKASISAMAAIKGELISKQLGLTYLGGIAASNEPTVAQLQRQIGGLEARLERMTNAPPPAEPQAGSGSGAATTTAAKRPGNGDEFFPVAMNVPSLRFELEQLMRDQKVKDTVFVLLTQRYEIARVDGARDTGSFQILDYPTVATLRSRPARRKVAVFGGFAGALAGLAWVMIPLWWRRRLAGVSPA